jgi:hypothetical protein
MITLTEATLALDEALGVDEERFAPWEGARCDLLLDAEVEYLVYEEGWEVTDDLTDVSGNRYVRLEHPRGGVKVVQTNGRA